VSSKAQQSRLAAPPRQAPVRTFLGCGPCPVGEPPLRCSPRRPRDIRCTPHGCQTKRRPFRFFSQIKHNYVKSLGFCIPSRSHLEPSRALRGLLADQKCTSVTDKGDQDRHCDQCFMNGGRTQLHRALDQPSIRCRTVARARPSSSHRIAHGDRVTHQPGSWRP